MFDFTGVVYSRHVGCHWCGLLSSCMLSLEWSNLGLYVVAGVVCYLLHACVLSLDWSTLGLYVVAGVV